MLTLFLSFAMFSFCTKLVVLFYFMFRFVVLFLLFLNMHVYIIFCHWFSLDLKHILSCPIPLPVDTDFSVMDVELSKVKVRTNTMNKYTLQHHEFQEPMLTTC